MLARDGFFEAMLGLWFAAMGGWYLLNLPPAGESALRGLPLWGLLALPILLGPVAQMLRRRVFGEAGVPAPQTEGQFGFGLVLVGMLAVMGLFVYLSLTGEAVFTLLHWVPAALGAMLAAAMFYVGVVRGGWRHIGLAVSLLGWGLLVSLFNREGVALGLAVYFVGTGLLLGVAGLLVIVGLRRAAPTD